MNVLHDTHVLSGELRWMCCMTLMYCRVSYGECCCMTLMYYRVSYGECCCMTLMYYRVSDGDCSCMTLIYYRVSDGDCSCMTLMYYRVSDGDCSYMTPMYYRVSDGHCRCMTLACIHSKIKFSNFTLVMTSWLGSFALLNFDRFIFPNRVKYNTSTSDISTWIKYFLRNCHDILYWLVSESLKVFYLAVDPIVDGLGPVNKPIRFNWDDRLDGRRRYINLIESSSTAFAHFSAIIQFILYQIVREGKVLTTCAY